MCKDKLDLTPVRKKLLLAYKHHAKITKLKRRAAKDIKNIIKKSNLVQDLGDYFERVEIGFNEERCKTCNPYRTAVEIHVTKDTPEKVQGKIARILYTTLPGSALGVHKTDRTSQEKKVEGKEVKSYE